MARIKGVDIPNNKRIVISLTYIYGIGNKRAEEVLTALNIDWNIKAKDLTDDQIQDIRNHLNDYVLEGDLRRDVNTNIKTQMEINSYVGSRHKKNLPCRGQNTRNNARTRRGKKKQAVANKKK